MRKEQWESGNKGGQFYAFVILLALCDDLPISPARPFRLFHTGLKAVDVDMKVAGVNISLYKQISQPHGAVSKCPAICLVKTAKGF